MPGIPLVKKPTWQGKTAALVSEQARSHVFIYAPRDFPTDLSAGASWNADPADSGDYGGGGYSVIQGNGSWQEWNIGNLKAGTWNIGFWASKGVSRAIFQFSINGTNLGAAQDRYNNALLQLAPVVDIPFTLLASGLCVLRMTNTGKNAASSGYDTVVHLITLDRTGA